MRSLCRVSADLNRADGAAELSPSGPYRGLKQLGLVLLCAAWIVLGLFGHDPWKADDATAFGMAYDMLKQGDWVVPHLAGMPVPDRPPLSARFWPPRPPGRCAASCRCTTAPTPQSACASVRRCGCSRSPAANSMAVAFRWLPVLIFVGCVGLWDRGHLLSPEIGLLLADALALTHWRWRCAGPLPAARCSGSQWASAFLCRGPMRGGNPRADRRGAAAVCSLAKPPLRAVRWRSPLWLPCRSSSSGPLALYLRSPALFAQWADAQSLAHYFGLTAKSPPREPLYYLKNLPWFAWPALPLALWTLWVRGRGYNGSLSTPGVQLPGMYVLHPDHGPLGRAGATGEPRAAAAWCPWPCSVPPRSTRSSAATPGRWTGSASSPSA